MYDVKKQTEYQWMTFIVKELEDIPGGISVALADLRNDVPVPPGAYIGADENGLGHIIKGAVLLEDVAAGGTEFKVSKFNQFKAGDFVTSKDKEGVKAYAIASVDITNVNHDVVKVSTALGVALSVGNSLIVVKAEDAEGGKSDIAYQPIGITKREIDTSQSHAYVGVLVRGTVNVANMAYGAPKVLRDALGVLVRYEE